MYCAHCGIKLPEEATTCPSCLTPTDALDNCADKQDVIFGRQKNFSRLSQEARDAREAANIARSGYMQLWHRFVACCGVGVVISAILLSSLWESEASSSTVWYSTDGILVSIAITGCVFTLVFGMSALMSFVKRHGIFVWGSIFFFIGILMAALCLGFIIGPIYPIYLLIDISSRKKHAESLEQEALRLERAAAAA